MNGIIVIDKPAGYTSHDVIAVLRGIFKERRIGHAGTLDPIATGVLPVFVGRATRAIEFCENTSKRYVADIRFGITTDTQDTTGTVLTELPCNIDFDRLKAVLPRFIGEIEQIPPMYSAIKQNGKKLYELARSGIEVERKARKITIFGIEILGMKENGDFVLDVTCSKGTYIRTLCEDIGNALGCGAAMSGLRRTAVGDFSIDEAIPLEELKQNPENASRHLLPTDSLFRAYDAMTITGKALKCCKNGADFKYDIPDGLYRFYSSEGEFLMLGNAAGGTVSNVKSFFNV